VRSGIYRQIF